MDAMTITRHAAAAAGVDQLVPWTRDATDPRRRLSFYVGSHMPKHLETSPVPLFISRRTLAKYAGVGETMPKARIPWALDSGGFTELSKYGRWTVDEDTYGGEVYRFMDDVGPMTFAAPQDWMCEPWIIEGGTHRGMTFPGTGLSVAIHQELTVENLLYLRENFPHAPWMPVLQGWTLADYLRHVDMYREAGIDLEAEHLVGLGSVCRRESTDEIGLICSTLAGRGLRLHGFGVKTAGLRKYGQYLASADSLAWSFGARIENKRLPTCEHRGPCSNCLTYAVSWREGVLAALTGHKQDSLDLLFAA